LTDEEAAARAINAQPWKPLPGMMKPAMLEMPLLVRHFWPSTKEERCKDCANDGR